MNSGVSLNVFRKYVGSFALAGTLALLPAPLLAKESSAAMDVAKQLNQAFIEVADKVSPAVVVIRVAHKPNYEAMDEDNPLWEWLPPQFRKQFEERRDRQHRERPSSEEPIFDGQGSGVVIREDGYLLTNRHVVEGADKIKVRFRNGKEYEAEVRGVDAKSDIAVIKIDAKGLTVAKLADSDKVRVGEFAIAIGAPFELDYSVTFGHVSAKGRSDIIGGPEGAVMDQDFIQTDANINPGNSGGPLVNIDGEVMGINTLIRGLRTGIGFAIPSNLAREVSDQLIAEGKFARAWLGVGIRALRDYTNFRKMTESVDDGVVVLSVSKEGPAAKSDLKPADIITAVDGKKVSSAQQLRNEIRSKKIGSSVTLDVVRNEKPIKIKVKTEEWPDENIPVSHRPGLSPEMATKSLGLTVQALTKDLAEQFGVELTEGVIVTGVERGSPAEREGIKPGDVITEINHESVTNPKQFKEAAKKADPKKGVVINLVGENGARFEILKDSGE